MHPTLSLCTATATCCSWLAFKLLILHLELSTFIIYEFDSAVEILPLISTLLTHYGTDISAETLQGEETIKEAIISPDISTEWKTFRQFIAKQPTCKENMKLQLKELATNEMLKVCFLT